MRVKTSGSGKCAKIPTLETDGIFTVKDERMAALKKGTAYGMECPLPMSLRFGKRWCLAITGYCLAQGADGIRRLIHVPVSMF